TTAEQTTRLIFAVLTGVGVGDLVGLVRIQPDLLLTAAQDAGGQPLLEPEHICLYCNTSSVAGSVSRNAKASRDANMASRSATSCHSKSRIIVEYKFGKEAQPIDITK
uniref:Uncharacterized protein n=1 Tax=Sphaeramia orbicularis TaxID=375764 RepID=A0A673A2C1_9TELE